MNSVLVVFAAVMVVTYASNCNMLQRIKVKQQWAQAYSSGVAREDFGEAVWKALVLPRCFLFSFIFIYLLRNYFFHYMSLSFLSFFNII